MESDNTAERNFRDAQALSRKIQLLLDVVVAHDGQQYEFTDIQQALAGKGVKLSRTRWHHIKTGTSTVKQPEEIIIGLAEFFDVDKEYLLKREGEVPERIQHELELLAAMRRAKVKDFATRTLADVDNETLDAITALLNDSEKY